MICELRNKTWRQIYVDRRAWGRACMDFYVLDQDHVLLVFYPDGARELV
jgi:hypothetical protein